MRIRIPAVRLTSLLLFAALCAITAYWALQLLAPRAPLAPSGSVAQAAAPPDLRVAGQLFGGAATAPAAAAAQVNIQVVGVVAAGARGVALLAVEGRPSKPFAVGEQVTEGVRVEAVAADAVTLTRYGQPTTLPAPARGSVAVLTSNAGRTAAASGSAATGVGGQTPPPPPPHGAAAAGAAAPAPGASPAAGMPPANPLAVNPTPTNPANPGAGAVPGSVPGASAGAPPGAPPSAMAGAPPSAVSGDPPTLPGAGTSVAAPQQVTPGRAARP
jgi:general secretion pathway protein C